MSRTHRAAQSLLSPGRGILVLDEYVERAAAPFRTEEFVDVVLDTPGLESCVSAVLMSQPAFDGSRRARELRRLREPALPLQLGVLMRPGPGDDVPGVLAANLRDGATVAEWRAHTSPLQVPRGGVHVDAAALARGVAASQAEEVLPVVTVAMPDLATQSLGVTQAVTANALRELFDALDRQDVDLTAMVLRVNLVRAGDAHPRPTSPEDAARATLRVLAETVPDDVAGVAVLSGGRGVAGVGRDLGALVARARRTGSRRRLTFAFGRALADTPVRAWAGSPGTAPEVQRELVRGCRQASQALLPFLPGDPVSA